MTPVVTQSDRQRIDGCSELSSTFAIATGAVGRLSSINEPRLDPFGEKTHLAE